MTEGERILIVEDDSDVREALAAFLESEGYGVVEAEHGEVALRRLRTATRFCLILARVDRRPAQAGSGRQRSLATRQPADPRPRLREYQEDFDQNTANILPK